MSQIQKINPSEVAQKLANGATLIDIRSPDEFARTHINGAVCVPIDSLDKDKIAKNTNQNGDNVVIFHCLSGMRTAQNADKITGWCPEKCADLNLFRIIHRPKTNIKCFNMVKQCFRKTATAPYCST